MPTQDFLTDPNFYNHRNYPLTDKQRLKLKFTENNRPSQDNYKELEKQIESNKMTKSFVDQFLSEENRDFTRSKL